jgi:hypothetical protein
VLTIAITCAVLVMLAAPAFATNPPGGDLLPDLTMKPPRDLSIELAGSEKRLRFTIESDNVDTGPLEIFPQTGPGYDDCNHDGDPTNDRTVFQRIYRDANNDGVFTRGIDTASRSRLAGCMVFHVAHNHWHFDDYAQFELRDAAGTAIVRGTKTSFCLTDSVRSNPGLPGSPSGAYYLACDQVTPQGISVGWGDVYGSNLAGQYLVINGVPDGDYCAVSTADPVNKLLETNESNNTGSTRFRLRGNSVALLTNTPCIAGPGGPFFVYDDSLQWDDWSWDSTINPNATSPVFSGARSISVKYNAAWAALSLHSPSSFSTASFTQLHFAVLPGSIPLSGLLVGLYNSSDTPISYVTVQPYASSAAGGWYTVNIPLSDLGASNTTIGRVTIQEGQGAAQPTLYVDEVKFTGS